MTLTSLLVVFVGVLAVVAWLLVFVPSLRRRLGRAQHTPTPRRPESRPGVSDSQDDV